MIETYVKRVYENGSHIERKTGRGNKGNEKYQELSRLEEEWKKEHYEKAS